MRHVHRQHSEVLLTANDIVRVDHRAADAVLPLFAGFVPPQLHIQAVLGDFTDGGIYVDSRDRPRAACLFAGDACYLGGAPSGPFLDAVNALFPRDHYTALFAAAGISGEDIARAVDGLYMLPARRRAAFLRRLPDAEFPLPRGVELRGIDSSLLESAMEGADGVRDEILSEWRTVDRFLRDGFGAVAVVDNRVVAHSIADYVTPPACEIGIHVAADCRRRHIGTAVAGQVAREAFARGLGTVAWHSWANNAGSIGVSRNVGFGQETFYTVYINHWAAENWSDMLVAEFRAFAEEYERLFATCPPASSGYPHVVAATAWASARDRVSCLRHLHRAVDMGWLKSTEQLRELWPELFFDPTLHARVPEWGKFFARLDSSAKRAAE
jgi:ribosomal protein S18 acetylase RimI-like enzyme